MQLAPVAKLHRQLEVALSSGLAAAAICAVCVTFTEPTLIARADEPDEFQLSYGEIKAGKKTYTVAASSKLTSAPKDSAATIATLSIASPLQVVSKDEASKTVNGFLDSWYKVTTNDKKTGFIWGGNLSKSALQLSATDTLLLTIEGTGNANVNKQARAVLVRNGKFVSECKFKPIEMPESHTFSYSLGATKLPTKGFSGSPTIAKFRFEYGACDYPFGDVLIGVVNDKVTHLMEFISVGNEQGGASSEFILPTMKGGKPNSLIVVDTTENYQEKKKTTKRQVYSWSGTQFKRTK